MFAPVRTWLSNRLDAQWQRCSWLCLCMMPFSALVKVILSGRRLFYRLLPALIYRAPVPVVVVGNIYVGGTGKTPAVMAIVQALQSKGWQPGVISRGYGVRLGSGPRVGQGKLQPEHFGDEPALIAAQSGTPVAVHPNRRLAIECMLDHYPEVDVIVSDDGLQHLALARDVEIVVQDSRGTGNGHVMPAGPLRESAHRLGTVDAILTNLDYNAPAPLNLPVKSLTMHLEMTMFRHLVSGQSLSPDQFKRKHLTESIAAAAGIGSPERFFNSLRRTGLNLDSTRALPDHHAFNDTSFEALNAAIILITAKDAIKCLKLNDPRLWVVEVNAVLSDPDFAGWLDRKIQRPPLAGNLPSTTTSI